MNLELVKELCNGYATCAASAESFAVRMRGEIVAPLFTPPNGEDVTAAFVQSVKDGEAYAALIAAAREAFGAAYYDAPRYYGDGRKVDLDAVRAAVDAATTKAAARKLSKEQVALREHRNQYVRRAINATVVAFIPKTEKADTADTPAAAPNADVDTVAADHADADIDAALLALTREIGRAHV